MNNSRATFLVELYMRYKNRLVPIFDIEQVKAIVCLVYDIEMEDLNNALLIEFSARHKG